MAGRSTGNDPRLEAYGDEPGSDVCACTRVALALAAAEAQRDQLAEALDHIEASPEDPAHVQGIARAALGRLSK